MRDITITNERMRREARVFGLCGSIALSVNALSIVYYDTSWIELVTTLHVTVTLAVTFYLVYAGARNLLRRVRSRPARQRKSDR